MTVRPTVWQPVIIIPWSVLVGGALVGAVFLQGGVSFLAVLLVMFLTGWAWSQAIRLEITSDAVRVRMFWFEPRTQVARSQIRAIHYYPAILSFRGPDGEPAMRTRCEWSLKQMITVAAELRVPGYDNRGRSKLLGVRMGQLVYNPADDQPAG
jgi:hypothetical protein